MVRIFPYTCCILWILLFSSNALATCQLNFSGLSNQVISVDAGTIDTSNSTRNVNFTVQNTGSSTCYYFVTIDEGSSRYITYDRRANIKYIFPMLFQQANRSYISYQLYSQSIAANNVVKTLDQAVFAQNVLGPRQILAGQSVAESFIIDVPIQTLPNIIAESYDDDLLVTLYRHPNASVDYVNDCPACIQEDQLSLNIQFEMTEYAALSIGDSYNPTTRTALLDFDLLQTNEQQSFEVFVGGRTTSGTTCAVTISSLNGSKLVRANVVGPPQSYDQVPYTVQAQSNMGGPIVPGNIDLSAPNTPVTLATSNMPFVCGNNNQGVMGIDVFITMGTVNYESLMGGLYRDTLTIEATIGL